MFAIATDTSSNLPTKLLQSHEITVVPFTYHANGIEDSCLDTEKFDGHKFYDLIRSGEEVNTSQITPQIFIDYLTPVLEKGNDLLFISMSSGISGSFASSCIATEELKEAFPERKIISLDTLSASLAEGMVVLKAVELRDKGYSLEETEKELLDYRMKIAQVFTVDDLMHLTRTGRVSVTKAKIGTFLGIKPVLVGNEEGKIIPASYMKGMKLALRGVADKFKHHAKKEKHQLVCIAHTDAWEEAAYLEKLIRSMRDIDEVMTVMYEPVTGAHVGPGAIALFFESDAMNVRFELPKIHILPRS